MTEELTGQAALAAKLSVVIHEFCEDLPRKDSERIGADAARAAWDCGSTREVRVFRYVHRADLSVYRSYPDGRFTRNGESADPSDLSYCETLVSQGKMTETVEVQP